MGKLIILLAAVLGITFTISVTIGPCVVGVSQTPEGQTNVYHGGTVENVEKGTMYCAHGCQPDAKPEKYESVDLNPEDFVALNLNRTNGIVTTEYGLKKTFSAFNGNVALTFSATRSAAGADILDSWPVRAVLPTSVRKKAKSWVGETKPLVKAPDDWFKQQQRREQEQKFAQTWARLQKQNAFRVQTNRALDEAIRSSKQEKPVVTIPPLSAELQRAIQQAEYFRKQRTR